jgi:hypothetical protein
MFPVPEASLPASEICSESPQGIQVTVLHIEVGKRRRSIVLQRRIVVHARNGIDQLDDQLRHEIARRRAPKMKRPRDVLKLLIRLYRVMI